MTKKKALKSTEIVKPLTKQEVKKRIGRVNYYDEHPDRIYDKLGDLLTKSNIKDWSEEETEYINKHLRSIDNFSKSHVGLAETQDCGNLRTTVIELTNNLIEEYSCATTLEKTLCEIVANSYGNILQISKKMTTCMSAGQYLSNERTNWMNMLSKELDRANRSYLTALNNLLDIKRPQMNINVKTKNAYFGENQQINNNEPKNENIKD